LAKIRVAIIGVGNCASSFIQGLQFYEDCEAEKECIGLRNLYLANFHPRDIEIVAAYDIDARKVGKDLCEAVFVPPNNTLKLVEVPKTGVVVSKGSVLDGIGNYTKDIIRPSDEPSVNVVDTLRETGTEIVVNLLPSGAEKASRWYADQALKARCAFVNATPVFIASNKEWANHFVKANLPVVGDDLIDQVGATTLHKTLLKLLSMHGVQITRTYQLDVGGGTESLDTLDRTRDIKRDVKTKSVKAALPYEADVVAGSTDYVDFLENRRDSYFWIEGLYFCGVPLQVDLRLSTVDAPNAGSTLIDVIRAVKVALERKLKGAIAPISGCAFKHPPEQMSLETAKKRFDDFINEDL
jgi:myo-inositol-1-phosphate synthase